MNFPAWLNENRGGFGYLDLIPIPDGTVGVWLERDGIPAHYVGLFSMVRLPCAALAASFVAV
jgi:hypothetical protein